MIIIRCSAVIVTGIIGVVRTACSLAYFLEPAGFVKL